MHKKLWSTHCFCHSATQSCLTLCDSMDCSTPGLPVPHHLPEFAQVHVHYIGDAIQPSHPMMPSSYALNLSQHQGLFQRVGYSQQVTKILELQLQHQSFQWVFRVDFLQDWLVWSPRSSKDSQEFSPGPQFKGLNSLGLCLLYGPALTTIHDHWEDQSLDSMDLCWQSDISDFQHTVSRFAIAFFLRSNRLLILRLQSPSAVILEPKKRKSVTTSTSSLFYLPWSNGAGCHDLNFVNTEF